jgi:catechol 2,3-dioxygenase
MNAIKPVQTAPAPIHPQTRLGAVHLMVSDLGRSLSFYQGVLGFQLRERQAGVAHLGAGGDDLLVLTEQPGARRFVRGHTGLYHFAVLVPSRLELARALRRMAEARVPMDGFSDHKVSEALYLPDPDGNGLEVYRDRARDEWPNRNSLLGMTTDPLDVEGVLGELRAQPEPAARLAPETVIGHVHLHVANLAAAEQFYLNVIGFDVMARYGPSASFASAGGYHHHLGINTWAGVGAPPAPPDAVGLRHFEIRVPDQAALDQAVDRARAADVGVEERADDWLLRDPSQNAIALAQTAPAKRDTISTPSR